MKYIKIFALGLIAAAFTACSDSDSMNTNPLEAGFTKTSLKVKESQGLVNIPIEIEGYRNGDISIEVEAVETGTNPAIEGKHFQIVEKNIKLLAKNDTTANAQLNVELQLFDNDSINEERTLILRLKSNDINLTKRAIFVTIRDNDAEFFEKFMGKWTMTYLDSDGAEQSTRLTIGGPTDEEDPDYNVRLTANCGIDVGAVINTEFHMYYTFDPLTKEGTLTINDMEEMVGTYSTAYHFWFALATDAMWTATWKLDENDQFPTEIQFEGPNFIYFYDPAYGWFDKLQEIKFTR